MSIRRVFGICVTVLILFALVTAAAEEHRKCVDIARDMVSAHAGGEKGPGGRLGELLSEMEEAAPGEAEKWTRILALWDGLEAHFTVNAHVLPDGLPDTEELAIVALGYQLNADGSMREELYGRLNAVLQSAGKYPRAYIVCTGGHTAYQNPDASEAGMMAEWLAEQGVKQDRLIVEDQSLTTGQNVVYSVKILREQYPFIRYLAVITSDYHVPVGVLLLEAQAILLSDDAGVSPFHVISNAAYPTTHGSLSPSFGGSALTEVARGQYGSEY